MNTACKFEKYARGALWLALLMVIVLLPFYAIRVEKGINRRINSVAADLDARIDVVGARLSARDQQVGLLLKQVSDYAEQNYWDVYALNETAVTTARQFSEFLRKTDININGGEGRKGIFDDLHDLLQQTNKASAELEADVHRLLVSGNKALEPLASALNDVASITTKLDKQMTTTGEGVDKLVQDLDKAIGRVDRLLADPNIQATLLNVQESTKSIDIALRPWRERAHLLKVILGRVLSMAPGIGTALAK